MSTRSLLLIPFLGSAMMLGATQLKSDGYIFETISDTSVSVAVDPDNKTMTSITLPESVQIDGKKYSVTTIAAGGFENQTQLTSIKLPQTVTAIESRAFYGCSGIKSIDLHDGLLTIGDQAFYSYGGAGIENLAIPATVTSIGQEAFYNAPISNLVIEGGKDSAPLTIGANAFNGTSQKIDNLYISRPVPPTISEDTFNSRDYAQTKLILFGDGINSQQAYKAADGWKNFQLDITTGIDEIGSDASEAISGIYTISGAYVGSDLESLPAGIYVVRKGDSMIKVRH